MSVRYLFIDMNSFFASAEQQDRPELRGRPVAVVPVLSETTCCIAASYEAKRHGVKTGTRVGEARRLCPGLCVVEARTHHYVAVHHRVIRAVETCAPVSAVLSIDEMACRLHGTERQPEGAVRLARQVKRAIARDLGPCLRCSIGIAPNVLLAKVASDAQKPDGLTLIQLEDLPGRLFSFRLTDFPGIGPRMAARLARAGVTEVRQLCELGRPQLAAIWGSRVVAERWWRRLRGEDVPDPPTRRQSVSHSHVLAPRFRNDADARAVLAALIHKAAARLRRLGYRAASLTVFVTFLRGPTWQARRHFLHCHDTLTLIQVFRELWPGKPAGTPLHVGVILGHLRDGRAVTPSLFEADRCRDALAAAMDRINARFGGQAICFASA